MQTLDFQALSAIDMLCITGVPRMLTAQMYSNQPPYAMDSTGKLYLWQTFQSLLGAAPPQFAKLVIQ